MSDTDVYRVVVKHDIVNGIYNWIPVTSNRHPNGLWPSLKSVKMSISARNPSKRKEPGEYKVQKLTPFVDYIYPDNRLFTYLEWEDVDG